MQIIELLVTVIFIVTALRVSYHDFHTLRIPDRILLPRLIAVGCLAFLAAITTNDWQHLHRAALGTTISAATYLVLHLLTKGGIGFGDVKFALLIGFVLGWLAQPSVLAHPSALANPSMLALPAVLSAVVATFIGAALCGIVLTATSKTTLKSNIPLAPFMAVSAIAILLGTPRDF